MKKYTTNNRIRRILAAAALLGILLLGGCGGADTGGVRSHGQLKVTEGVLTDDSGRAFQLRGMSTHGIAWFPQYINSGSFAEVKNAGGNLIRVAMYTDTENGYLRDPEGNLTLVCQAIENAKALDMYVLVDWHILSDGDPNANLDAAITFFDAVASRYPGDPGILYEICNEPNGVSWEDIHQYAYAIFPVIRQYSPEAVIILGTPDYSSNLNVIKETPFPGENFLYAYHYYAGQHPGYRDFREAVDAGIPLMVSEWGINYDDFGNVSLEEGEEFAEYLNSKGISWCAWSLCNKDEVFSVLRPDCTSLSGWQSSDLTEVGQVIFAALSGGK